MDAATPSLFNIPIPYLILDTPETLALEAPHTHNPTRFSLYRDTVYIIYRLIYPAFLYPALSLHSHTSWVRNLRFPHLRCPWNSASFLPMVVRCVSMTPVQFPTPPPPPPPRTPPKFERASHRNRRVFRPVSSFCQKMVGMSLISTCLLPRAFCIILRPSAQPLSCSLKPTDPIPSLIWISKFAFTSPYINCDSLHSCVPLPRLSSSLSLSLYPISSSISRCPRPAFCSESPQRP